MAMTQTVHAGEQDQHRAGQLHKLQLENFMCHENFEMYFGPHVNFISGTNGSGKSAVLQGIQACLGVRASDTGRSNSLGNFIKTGAHHAMIAVTVFNTGQDAYQPELYGDFITVERRIGAQSGFVLKNASGRKVASGRNALTAMLDALNLNASNPVAVLTQDTSRDFLAGAASGKKTYDLFMQASLLEEISENYNASQESIDAQREILSLKKKELKEAQAAVEELKQRVDDLLQMKDKKALSDTLTKALAWAKVYEQDHPLEMVRQRLEVEGPARMQQTENQLMEAQAEAKVLSEELQAKKASVQGIAAEIQQLTREAQTLQAEHKRAKTRLLEASKRVQHIEKELADTYQQREDVASTAEEEHQEMIHSTQAAIDDFKKKLDTIEEQSQQLQTQEYETQTQIKEQHAILQQKAAEEEELNTEVERTRKSVQEVEADLRRMRSSPADDVTRFFHPKDRNAVNNLLQKIHAQKGAFHRPPVGPVGQHLSIEDEKWGVAVEKAIGPIFKQFVVHDSHDAEVLRKLAGQSGFDLSHFSCAVRSFDIPLHNIPANVVPPPEVPTVLRMLKCKTPEVEAIVMNYIIDKTHAEHLALAEDMAEGKRLAYGNQFRGVIIRAFLRDGSTMQQRGQSQSFQGAGRGQRPTLSKNLASSIAGMERYISEQSSVLRDQQARLKAAQHQKRAAEAAVRKAHDRLKTIKSTRNRLMSEQSDIRSQRPDDVLPHQDAASMVQAQMQEINDQIFDLEQTLADKKVLQREAAAAEAEALVACSVKKSESDKLKAKNDDWAAEIAEKGHGVRNATQNAEKLKNKLENLQRKLDMLSVQKAQHEAARRQAEDTAKEYCTETEGQEALQHMKDLYAEQLGEQATEEEIQQRLQADPLEEHLRIVVKEVHRSEHQAGGTLEELEPKLEAEEKRHRTKKRRFEQFYEPVKMLVKGLDPRRKRLKDMGRRIEAQVQSRFKHYMSQKGNIGTIRLNRAEGKLVVSVTMSNSKNEKNSGPVEDLKSLSGGEKSFTTVSFILALGEITENPFRAMDEFDVFMDSVNRRISMQSLIKFAYQLNHVQFLFLTPQDISAVEDAKRACEKEGEMELTDDFIKVVRMQPARENASRA
mmetsp:Transcript_40647/g.102878  ORF Transcript_40647/g.102878 Transcript_40647/m.102878 type:complete len:1107 (-) Transcript_40647:369-3689(-)